jgi:hypothetical protein
MDGMGYDERRATLREFGVQVTLWKRDHDPRFAIDWAFDLGAWDAIDQEVEPWVIYTTESAALVAPLVNSSA